MRLFNLLVAQAIRNGDIIVHTPDLDLEELERILHDRMMESMRRIAQVVYCDEMTDQEKVELLKDEMVLW